MKYRPGETYLFPGFIGFNELSTRFEKLNKMKPTKLSYDAQLDDAAEAVATHDRELVRACMDSVLIGTSHLAEAWLMQA